VIINAGANDVVTLRNLSINGAGTTLGLNGIRVLSARAVFVENVQAFGFSQKGIDIAPTTNPVHVFVKDSIFRNNTTGGIFGRGPSLAGTVNVTLDNVRLERNGYGYKGEDFSKANVRDSSASGNVNNGFWGFSSGGAVELNIENSRSAANAVTGVRAENAGTTIRITDVTVTGNVLLGVQAAAGASLLSFGNNRIAGNGTNGTPSGTILQQ
jgi:hypothetical protein